MKLFNLFDKILFYLILIACIYAEEVQFAFIQSKVYDTISVVILQTEAVNAVQNNNTENNSQFFDNFLKYWNEQMLKIIPFVEENVEDVANSLENGSSAINDKILDKTLRLAILVASDSNVVKTLLENGALVDATLVSGDNALTNLDIVDYMLFLLGNEKYKVMLGRNYEKNEFSLLMNNIYRKEANLVQIKQLLEQHGGHRYSDFSKEDIADLEDVMKGRYGFSNNRYDLEY